MEDWLPVLARYVDILARSADATTFANDRPAYQRHLASAARLVSLLATDAGKERIEAWLDDENHGFGWGYLSGQPGEEAERAFHVLAAHLREGLSVSK